MASRRVKDAYLKAEGTVHEECFDCDVTKRLVRGLIEARSLQPIDNAIIQDLDDAIDALAEWVLANDKTEGMEG